VYAVVLLKRNGPRRSSSAELAGLFRLGDRFPPCTRRSPDAHPSL